jgi:hypothetical protein
MNNLSRYIFVVSVILSVLSNPVKASDKKYPITDIPLPMLLGPSAVVRNNTVEFIVEDDGSAVKKTTIAVTVFNKEERDYGVIRLMYDKTTKVDELEGHIYNADGEEVAELDDDDIKDYSSYKDFNLYDDNRIKEAELYYNSYPYTVEFTYEMDYDGYVNWPEWFSRNSTDAVQSADFIVSVPKEQELRFWCNRDSLKPSVKTVKSQKIYSWHWSNLPDLPDDATNNYLMDVADVVLIAPGKFEYEDTKGDMSTWKDFGMWAYNLWKGRRNLPPDAVQAVADIKSKSKNKSELISGLYKYLQKKCRYVSVQLGIGGLQPFDADYVQKRGYGDCKALANYMVALLESAGIEAYPALIQNGKFRLPIIEEFPSNQFNHVVACIPEKNDTTWLECTSTELLPGQIGWSNENRKAMLITPAGGILASTPVSASDKNYMVKHIDVKLGINITDVNVKSVFGGNQLGYISEIAAEVQDDKEKWLKAQFEAPSVKLNQYLFGDIDSDKRLMNLDYSVSLPQYASVTGNRIFFNPNLIEKVDEVPAETSKRLSPVIINYPYLDIDTISYELPAGYKIETIPAETHITASFGEYKCKITDSGDGKLIYARSLEIKKYMVPASEYNNYRKFYADIMKAERGKVVLVK